MRLGVRRIVALAALASTTPASAQGDTAAPPPTDGNTIIVNGNAAPPGRSEVYDQARDLTRMEGRTSRLYNEALPRFAAPLCPQVLGLKQDSADTIAARIRANAQGLKLRLADRRHCSPNLIVAFVDDGRSLIAGLERSHPQAFSLVPEAERSELLTAASPVRVWSSVEPKKANGAPLPRYRGKIAVPGVWGQMNRWLLSTRTDINTALVVFDREAVLGMTLTQLADYATMRGLTHTHDARADEDMETILALFAQEGRSPDALTSFDVGYLRSVYLADASLPAVNRLLNVRQEALKARDEEPLAP